VTEASKLEVVTTPEHDEIETEDALVDDSADVDHEVDAELDEAGDEADKPERDVSSVALATLQQATDSRAASLGSLAARLQEARAKAAGVTATAESNGIQPTAADSQVVKASSNGTAATATGETAYDALDSRSPMPEATEDETPIFRTLRSNWFNAGGPDGTWSTTEIEAGWQAAEQVAEAPALQLADSGLPMRRPGRRLVPGGVSPETTPVARDPEAIRARLAAHAAGVSRGRTAAVDESVPAPSTEEGHA
jgi:hypothetical protein